MKSTKMKAPSQDDIDIIKRKIDAAEKYRDSGYRDNWERQYKVWRNVVNKIEDAKGREVKDRSNISIPYSFVMLETILPRLVETLFAARPYITVKGKPKDIDEWREFRESDEKPWEQAAESMEKLLDYQHNVAFDIQDIFHIGLKIMALYGTTVGYTGWKYEEQKVIRKEKMQVKLENDELLFDDDGVTPVMDYIPQETEESTYDDPELEFLDLGLFYVDPNATTIENARYCGHTAFLTKEFLQQMHDAEKWHIDWDKIEEASNINEARNRRMSGVGLPTVKDDNIKDDKQALYEVKYYWEDDRCVVLINESYKAKDEANPYWHKRKPYFKDTYTKVPGEFYGIGAIEPIEDLQNELNTERNQRIDYRSMGMRRFFTQLRGANITPKNWEVKQFGRITVDSHDDIKEVGFNQLGAESWNQEETIKSDMRDATGAHDVVMGGGDSSETATGTMTKDNNAAMRFKLIISSAEKMLMVKSSQMQIQMNQQFIESERLLDMMGDDGEIDFVEITPEDIQGQFRLIPSGSSVEPMANKEAHKQRMIELYSIIANDPMMQEHPLKRRSMLKKVLEAFDIRDIDDILPTDEELNQNMFEQVLRQLPPELQQFVIQYMEQIQQSQQQPQQIEGQQSQAPQEPQQVGGGANTAIQTERGLNAV